MAFLTKSQIKKIGFACVGENVLISERAVFYNPGCIYLGSNIRIDDFSILSAGTKIVISDYVHIGAHCTVVGKGTIFFDEFSGISIGVRVFSSSDDYSGKFMTNPTVPDNLKRTHHEDVIFGKHAVVSANSVILPGVHLQDGCAVGANSLVKYTVGEGLIVAGSPAKFIGKRSNDIYSLGESLRKKDNIGE